MKKFVLFISLILFFLMGKSQKYSIPLYFEDSAGNRDTLYFGEDSSATFGIDERLGEVNFVNEPLDSTFAVFLQMQLAVKCTMVVLTVTWKNHKH